MAKPEWGLKRTCRECGKRFYDLLRDPIVCPGCQAVFDPLATLRPRRSRVPPTAAAKPAEPAAREETEEQTGEADVEADAVEVEDDDIEDHGVIDSEDDDSMIDDESDLGDDEVPEALAEGDD